MSSTYARIVVCLILLSLPVAWGCGGEDAIAPKGASGAGSGGAGVGGGGAGGSSTGGAAGSAGSSTGGAAGGGGTVGGAAGSPTGDASADVAEDGEAGLSADGRPPESGVSDAGADAKDGALAGDTGLAPSLKIMTFNIRYANTADGINAWTNRRDMVYGFLREQSADTAGLQEALSSQLRDLATALPEYARIGVGRNDGVSAGEFSAILYKTARFDVESSGTFWFSDTPEVPGSTSWGNSITRICTWGHFVEKGTGRAFYHFNVHLDHESQPSREKSVQLLMQRVGGRRVTTDPFIVTGDFNVGESNLVTRYMLGTATIGGMANPIPVIDSFRQLYPNAPGATFHGFNGGTSGDKIDYVYMGPNERATAAEIIRTQQGGVYLSDHYPVTGTIEMLGWR